MVASSESIKTKVSSCKKVTKPLMEKKRRARINTCLDQLKTLLEKVYSNNIRKRKLEKADILELTVKHLKHLQKTEKGSTGLVDYQAGFRCCLAGVNQYLLSVDANSTRGSSAHALLSSGLLRLGARLPHSSTADSDVTSAQRARASASIVTAVSVTRKPEHAHKRTELYHQEKTSANGLHNLHTHIRVNGSCVAPTILQQNYWRPW